MTSIDRVDLGLTDGSGCSCCATAPVPPSEPTSGEYETVVRVRGMTCSHCVASVTEELGSLDGVLGVTVALAPEGVSPVTISSSVALDRDRVRSAIEEAGYSLAMPQGEPSQDSRNESN